MWSRGLACLGLVSIVRALAAPPSSLLTIPSLNDAFKIAGNSSTPNDLGRPLNPGLQALNEFDIIWHRGSSIPHAQAAHVLYNVFIAVLACWRAPTNGPFDTTVTSSSSRYNDIVIVMIPGTATVANRFTPNLTGALLWRTILKYLDPEPTYWIASLLTMGQAPQTVGLVQTEVRTARTRLTSKVLDSASSSMSSPINANAEKEVSTDPGNKTSIKITSDPTISEQIDFREPLGFGDPRDSWLKAFLLWSSEMLMVRSSLDDVTVTAQPDIIRERRFPTTTGFTLVFQAKTGDARPPQGGPPPLTYDEFMRGILGILEIVVATSQYQRLDAKIFKDGWMAATFRVFFEPEEDLGSSSVAATA